VTSSERSERLGLPPMKKGYSRMGQIHPDS
jgi:hypothetical protein